MAFSLDIDAARMECRISWQPDGDAAQPPAYDDLVAFLMSKGIDAHKLDWLRAAMQAVQENGTLRGFLVAQGKLPQPPCDGSITWTFDAQQGEPHAGRLGEHERIDFRERASFVAVQEGALLGRWTEPQPGVAGIDVFGKVLKPPGTAKANRFKIGKGVELRDNGHACYAKVPGHVVLRGEQVSVESVLRIAGDVDYREGNVHYPGSVEISGNVVPGFVVEADGDIKIGGGVDHAEIRASGSVVIGGGVTNGARLIIGGDVRAKFLQDCFVDCLGAVRIDTLVTNSTIATSASLSVMSRTGRSGVVGGRVCAQQHVITFNLGSRLGVSTRVTVGVNRTALLARQRALAAQQEISRDKQRIKAMIALAHELGQAADAPDPQKGFAMLRAREVAAHATEEQLAAIDAAIAAGGGAAVEVYGTVYPGAQVDIAARALPVTAEASSVRFKLDADRANVVVESLGPAPQRKK